MGVKNYTLIIHIDNLELSNEFYVHYAPLQSFHFQTEKPDLDSLPFSVHKTLRFLS